MSENSQSNSVVVRLNLSEEDILGYYRGSIKTVCANDIDGRVVHFPLNILHPYVTREGIVGEFIIFFDEQGRFAKIQRRR